ncbi:MAG: CE1 family esterase [Acidimicrobiales bacterium]
MRLLVAISLLALVGCGHTASELTTHHATVGGTSRTWLEFRPAHMPGGAGPLLLVFHGYGGTALDMLAPTGIAAEAAKDGFMVALPEGDGRAWNAGTCCRSTAADVAFVAKIITSLIARGAVDPARVYAVGFSNGGMFTYRLGCELADLLEGVGVVEGTMTAACPTHRPVDLVVVHQLADVIVPYGGTATPRPALVVRAPFRSVPASVALWERAERCVSPQAVTATLSVCLGGPRVEVDVIPGGAHVWPATATGEVATFFGLRP